MTRAVRVLVGADGRPVGRDAELVGLLAAYQDAVVRSPHLDPVTTELVRLRCARQHDCRICQSLRLTDARDAGASDDVLAKIDHYEASDLSERHKVALRLVDAFIWRPSEMSDELVRQAREHFSHEELAELLVDITKWSTQKIHVTLGTDGTDRVPLNETGIALLTFDEAGSARVTSA
ncbi:MAG: carboxymuconolactone decarboxylase family protein [Candidatus Nanopelagicales bacterium]